MPANPVAWTSSGPRVSETLNASVNWLLLIAMSIEPLASITPRKLTFPLIASVKPSGTRTQDPVMGEGHDGPLAVWISLPPAAVVKVRVALAPNSSPMLWPKQVLLSLGLVQPMFI